VAKTILYPGSFCPPTIGHSDLVERAAHHFEKVFWAVGTNSAKNVLFTVEERLDMMRYIVNVALERGVGNIEVVSFEESAVRFAESIGAEFILRGLRSTSDLPFELEIAAANRGICKNVETVCMFAKPHYATISSSIVREVASLGEKIEQYVHPYVAERLFRKIGKQTVAAQTR
jgi:pantetheine-phosphate adenylyltransferase